MHYQGERLLSKAVDKYKVMAQLVKRLYNAK